MTGIGLEKITCTFLEFTIVINMGYIDHCALTQMTQMTHPPILNDDSKWN